MLKDQTRPKSGAAIFREGLESEWQELKRTLFKLPPWFRVSQFFLAVGAEERLRRLAEQAERATPRDQVKKKKHEAKSNSAAAEPFSLLWWEVLDPVDRALLEEYAGLNG